MPKIAIPRVFIYHARGKQLGIYTELSSSGTRMARPLSRIEIAKPDIVKFFDESSRRVYNKSELTRILMSNRGFWRLTQGAGVNYFITFLTENSKLTELGLTAENYSGFIRYA